MTTQESFKRRVRARMATTGERYAAARRVLLAQAGADVGDRSARVWVAPPEMADDKVRAATGRDWNQWCDVIDGWPERTNGHAAIARRVGAEEGVSGWWAQTVTVGYERITGLRLPNQMADGTFAVNKSRTVPVDADQLRAALLADEGRAALFPDEEIELRSKPTAKALRLGLGDGVATVSLATRDDGRTTVTVQHRGLATIDDLERRRFWWQEWLDALADEVGEPNDPDRPAGGADSGAGS